MMTQDQYEAVRAQLDFRPRWWLGAASVALNLGTFAVGLGLMQVRHWAAYAASQLVLAIGGFQSFALLHECAHESFSRRRSVNTIVGHAMSVLCFIPYQGWKYNHQQHHAWSGHLEKDPGVVTLHRWRSSGRVPLLARIAWRSWIPVVAVSQIVNFWAYPLRIRGGQERSKRIRCAVSIVVLIAGVVALWAVIGAWGIRFDIVPAIVLYLFVTELVNLPHHADFPGFGRKLAPREQSAIARSCVYPPVISEIVMLNFNFHAEHHLFPRLPWYRMRAARRLVRPVLGADYHEAVAMSWNLRHRTQDIRRVMLVGTHSIRAT